VTHPPALRCIVTAPARLHLGFVDLHGGLGRQFGSIGLAIEGLDAVVSAEPDATTAVVGPHAARVAEIATRLIAASGRQTGLKIQVHAAPPAHAGLGSGTLIALAAGAACAGALGLARTPRELALLAGRGQRSGIGIAAFEQGGFLLDGGRGESSLAPPLLSRLFWPADWRCVLLLDERHEGLSGVSERSAFSRLAAMEEQRAGELARRVLVGLLPAVAEGNFRAFSQHIGHIQAMVGDYFAPAQGGRFTRPLVGECLQGLARRFDFPGIGQSSWGPTGFIFTPDAVSAEAVIEACRPRLAEGLRCLMVTGAARGARIELGN
jgi:beta-RFAP synthase